MNTLSDELIAEALKTKSVDELYQEFSRSAPITIETTSD